MYIKKMNKRREVREFIENYVLVKKLTNETNKRFGYTHRATEQSDVFHLRRAHSINYVFINTWLYKDFDIDIQVEFYFYQLNEVMQKLSRYFTVTHKISNIEAGIYDKNYQKNHIVFGVPPQNAKISINSLEELKIFFDIIDQYL